MKADRFVWVFLLGVAAGCARTEVDVVPQGEPVRDPAPATPGEWNRPRDRLRFADWPEVRSAAGEAVDRQLALADRAFDRGDFHTAVAAYGRAILLEPDLAYAYCNRGSARRRLEDYAGAIEDLSTAIRLRPDYALAYNNRGYARLEAGDPEGALVDFDRAIEIGDAGSASFDVAMAYRNRARAWRALGEFEKARADERRAKRVGAARRAP